MGFTDLQGALVNLKLVGAAGVPALFARGEFRELWDDPPDLETLKRRILKDRSVVAWEMHPTTGGGSHGWVGFINTGSPFLFVETLSTTPDFSIIHDAVLTVLPAFFGNTREEWIFIHLAAALDDEVRPMLVEAGFDPVEAPGYDPKKYASFVLRRETYEIYAGAENEDGEGGEDEELADDDS